MYTPSELEAMPKQMERYMKDLERRTMEDVVARIKKNKEITSAADWELVRLYELGKNKREVKRYIKQALNLSNEEINHIYKDAIRQGYERDKSIYKAKGKSFISFEKNKELQQSIASVMLQAGEDLKNITNTLGFTINLNGKMVFTPMSEYFSGILDGAMIDITSGAFDYNKTITRVISEMTNSGLRTVDYASGYTSRVNVAARRAIMTGVGQITGKISEMNAKKLDTEYYEVTWHGTARPSHQEWQGKVYTMQELKDICGYGTVGGLCGANCRHSFYAFVPGVSERTYTDEQLAEMNAKENEPTKYRDKEYTSYEATQRMRQMETNMRAYRERIKLMEQAEVDEDTLLNTKCRYQAINQQYTSFAKIMGLPQERSRVYGDGLGRVIK